MTFTDKLNKAIAEQKKLELDDPVLVGDVAKIYSADRTLYGEVIITEDYIKNIEGTFDLNSVPVRFIKDFHKNHRNKVVEIYR